jgi:cytochrome P450
VAGAALDDIDLTDPDSFVGGQPHEWYARLRREAPVFRHPEAGGPGFWVITRYRDIALVNRDHRRFSSSHGIAPPEEASGSPMALLAMDPPVHTRYRGLLGRIFTPRAIGRLEARVRVLAREAVDAFVAAGGGDFVTDVAATVPFRAIAGLVGVPERDQEDVFRWSNAIIPSSDPEYRATRETPAEANAAMAAYSEDLLAQRRRRPSDDVITHIAHAELPGGELTDAQRRGFVTTLVVGGSETTRHLLSHGLWALLAHPSERDRFVEGTVASTTLVEELLRWATPVTHHGRFATEDVEVAGTTIPAGDTGSPSGWSRATATPTSSTAPTCSTSAAAPTRT